MFSILVKYYLIVCEDPAMCLNSESYNCYTVLVLRHTVLTHFLHFILSDTMTSLHYQKPKQYNNIREQRTYTFYWCL
jgi:hypothetical protein